MANGAQTKISNLISLLSLIVSILSLFTAAAAVSFTVIDGNGILSEEEFNKRIAKLEEVFNERIAKLEEGFNGRIAKLEKVFNERIAELEECACGEGNPGADNPTASRIEVLFDNARLQPKNGGRSPSQALTESSPGIALTASQGAELDKLAAALLACAEPSQPVRLKLRGYSSTRAFVDETGTRLQNSNELNVQAANLRAKVVKDRLASQGVRADGGLDVEYQTWRTYADMARPFLDSGDSFRSTAQEQLNRVVFVELQDAGACQRDT